MSLAPLPDPVGEVALLGAGYDGDVPDTSPVPDWAEVRARLEAARNYWIITVRPDGRPHAAPVWGLWWRGTLWFSTGPESVKARNLAADSRLTVHLESGDDVLVLEGSAGSVPVDPAWFPEFADRYDTKYGYRPTPESMDGGGLFRMLPASALTWTEQTFPTGKFRWHWS